MDVVDKLVPFENINMGPIIGKGSFGSVFKAANKERIVAIKVKPFPSCTESKKEIGGNFQYPHKTRMRLICFSMLSLVTLMNSIYTY